MHLVIISGATRPQSKSNTAKVIAAFQTGFEENGNTTEVWYLSDRRQWKRAANAFEQNDHILIAFPLYVENIPGILLEFLSGLTPKQAPGTKLAFLIQGGFPEASQSRCCEAFLETLPAQLGRDYAGTLIKGDMFGTSLVDEKNRKKCWLLLPRWDEPLPKPAALKRPCRRLHRPGIYAGKADPHVQSGRKAHFPVFYGSYRQKAGLQGKAGCQAV